MRFTWHWPQEPRLGTETISKFYALTPLLGRRDIIKWMNHSRLELVNFHRHSLIYCSNSLSIIRRFFCNWCCKNMTSKLIGKPSVWWSSHEESQRGQALFPNISLNVATGFLNPAQLIHRIKILHRKLSMNVNGNSLAPPLPPPPSQPAECKWSSLNLNSF